MNETEVPVAVTVSNYGVERNNAVNVYAQPASDYSSEPMSAIGYASPPATSPHSTSLSVQARPMPPNAHVGSLPQPFGLQLDEGMMRVAAMGRSVKCLTVIDLILVLLLTIFQYSWIFLVWGPICGYYGVNRYHLRFMYVYVVYWSLRALTDAFVALVFGYWWFLLSLLVDLYIIRYVWQFCAALKTLPEASILALRTQSTAPQNTDSQV